MEIMNYKYLQSINIIFKYIIIFDIKDIIYNIKKDNTGIKNEY